MKQTREKLEAFIKDWGIDYWDYIAKTGNPHPENLDEFKSELLSLLQDVVKGQKDAEKELIDALVRYVKLLSDEISDNAVFLANHRIKSKRVEAGEKARAEISKLSNIPLVTDSINE